MYKLPDGTLCIYDDHFILNGEKNEVGLRNRNTNLSFNLSGNLNTQQQAATVHAQNLWGTQLAGTVPVDINVTFVDLGTVVLGGSFRQPHYWNPVTLTWYSSALGNQLAGYNVVPGMSDIRLQMNSNSSFAWFYGITGNPSGSQHDWITVMLHEITHGLGFSASVTSGGDYVYTTSVGSPLSEGNHGSLDRQLYEGTSGANLPVLTQAQRAALVISNNLFSGSPGSNLLAANGGVRVKMYAPSTWAPGSSVSHWDNSVTFTTFMKYSINSGFRCIAINTREVAIMRDMGWAIPGPCISNFSNQTVTGITTITGCSTLTVQNVTVSSNSMLIINSGGVVILDANTNVSQGAQLEIR
jgi:hypothetical protein